MNVLFAELRVGTIQIEGNGRTPEMKYPETSDTEFPSHETGDLKSLSEMGEL